MLSFPRKGLTLAMDFPYEGQKTLDLMKVLSDFVMEQNGAMYPAKDLQMSKEQFKTFYPLWDEFVKYKDHSFESDFSRRINLCQS
jgi:hypothetical protein